MTRRRVGPLFDTQLTGSADRVTEEQVLQRQHVSPLGATHRSAFAHTSRRSGVAAIFENEHSPLDVDPAF